MKMTKHSYHVYLQSSTWREKRKMILDHWDNRCAVCYSDKQIELHHRSYERLGNEKMTDLVPLCRRCHEYITFRDTLKGIYLNLDDFSIVGDNTIREYDTNNAFRLIRGGPTYKKFSQIIDNIKSIKSEIAKIMTQ